MACVDATDDSDNNSEHITTENFKNHLMRFHTHTIVHDLFNRRNGKFTSLATEYTQIIE